MVLLLALSAGAFTIAVSHLRLGGPGAVIFVFAVGAVMGMCIVLAQSFKQRRLRTLFRNSAVLAINLIHIQELGAQHVTETGQSTQSVEKPLPYAVPILIAAFAVVLNAWGAGS
jgi:hypothetical protein